MVLYGQLRALNTATLSDSKLVIAEKKTWHYHVLIWIEGTVVDDGKKLTISKTNRKQVSGIPDVIPYTKV